MKAFLVEPGRQEVLELLDQATVAATSRVSYVECVAAFARARRERRLTGQQLGTAIRHFDARWPDLLVVELDQSLAREAARLLQVRPLRAADSIHLASAHAIVTGSPADVRFACWDRRLWEAAADSGFDPTPPTRL